MIASQLQPARPMPTFEPIPPDIGRREFARLFAVSRETSERLEIYARRLVEWQRTINLVAPATLPQIWHRHFADSAQLLALAPASASTWFDLGAGAGFPGLVLAILLAERPSNARMVLIESDTRKAAFLGEVVRATGITGSMAVDIVSRRVELPATRAMVGVADVITARALAPMDRLAELAAPLFSGGTVAMFLKGRGLDAELVEAERRWRLAYELVPSRTNEQGRIVVVRALAAKAED